MESLKKYFSQFVSLKESEWELILNSLEAHDIKKGDYFLNYNKINKKLGWIEEGVCRYCYINDKGDEITKYFVSENQFMCAIESFNNQSPSTEAIQALTDVKYYSLSYEKYQILLNAVPNWSKLVNEIVTHKFIEKLKLLSPMIVLDAKTRYEQFMASNPTVINRISLGHIASHLGITQQSLSRLRRQLAFG